MNGSKLAIAVLPLLLAACEGDPLDPNVHEDGLTFSGDIELVAARSPGQPESVVLSTIGVRNDGFRPLQRTFLGGCFVERMQAFRIVGRQRFLAWDSSRRENPFACTDDLALVSLKPGQRADPHNWGFSARLSEIRDSLPAGRYAFAVWIRPGDEMKRLGVGELDLP